MENILLNDGDLVGLMEDAFWAHRADLARASQDWLTAEKSEAFMQFILDNVKDE